MVVVAAEEAVAGVGVVQERPVAAAVVAAGVLPEPPVVAAAVLAAVLQEPRVVVAIIVASVSVTAMDPRVATRSALVAGQRSQHPAVSTDPTLQPAGFLARRRDGRPRQVG